MEEKPAPKSNKTGRSPDHAEEIGLQDLQDYYLDQADEGKRQAIEAQIRDPKSEVSSFLRWLRDDGSPQRPDFPRLASLPAAEVEAAESKRGKWARSSDKRRSQYPRIDARDPDTAQR